GCGELLAHIPELLGGVDLQSEVVDAGRSAASGDREVDARILDHPLRVIGLGDGRRRTEDVRVEPDALVDIVDGDVNVEALHRDLLLRRASRANAMSHVAPQQQFSVRYATRPFIVAKLAE